MACLGLGALLPGALELQLQLRNRRLHLIEPGLASGQLGLERAHSLDARKLRALDLRWN